MYDFSVFYGDFKDKMPLDQFIKELTNLGGYEMPYSTDPYFEGTRISLDKAISMYKMDTNKWFKIDWLPSQYDLVEVVFYDYYFDYAWPFFQKYGISKEVYEGMRAHQFKVQREFQAGCF